MNSIFLPEQINVGYQKRNDTYTQKLAYIIYYDEKGVLRKEKSWQNWRDKSLKNDVYENTPMSGFVLNKKAGGYSSGWNARQAYIRVYDPRGFEFEITVANLLLILENVNSIKGKALEGEFVYGWDGTELVLIPVDSQLYKDSKAISKKIIENDPIKAKDLKIGATYLTKKYGEYVYMGKYDEYCSWSETKKKKKSFFFYSKKHKSFHTMTTIGKQLTSVTSEECVDDYASLFEKLECNRLYSPVDHDKTEFVPFTFDEFETIIKNNRYYSFYGFDKDKQKLELYRGYGELVNVCNRSYSSYTHSPLTISEAFEKFSPMWRRLYLANGKLYKEEKDGRHYA